MSHSCSLLSQDLFLNYPWNNFLHTQVEQCIRLIFENAKRPVSSSSENESSDSSATPPSAGPSESFLLAISLIKEVFIIHRLLDAYYNYCDTLPRPAFMGHLVKILDTIDSHASQVQEIKKCLDEMDADTRDLLAKFTTDVLMPTKARISKPLIADVNAYDFKDTQQQEAIAQRVRTSAPSASFSVPSIVTLFRVFRVSHFLTLLSLLSQAYTEFKMQQMTKSSTCQYTFDTRILSEEEANPIQ